MCGIRFINTIELGQPYMIKNLIPGAKNCQSLVRDKFIAFKQRLSDSCQN